MLAGRADPDIGLVAVDLFEERALVTPPGHRHAAASLPRSANPTGLDGVQTKPQLAAHGPTCDRIAAQPLTHRRDGDAFLSTDRPGDVRAQPAQRLVDRSTIRSRGCLGYQLGEVLKRSQIRRRRL